MAVGDEEVAAVVVRQVERHLACISGRGGIIVSRYEERADRQRVLRLTDEVCTIDTRQDVVLACDSSNLAPRQDCRCQKVNSVQVANGGVRTHPAPDLMRSRLR